MRAWTIRGRGRWMGICAALLLALAACDVVDDDGDGFFGGDATDTDDRTDHGGSDDVSADTGDPGPGLEGVPAICDKVFQCGGFGWPSVEDCEAGWVGNDAMGTACADEAGYVPCAEACTSRDCAGFSTCETGCWDAHCS